jgi:integral membrane protein (TIGR01906 family)
MTSLVGRAGSVLVGLATAIVIVTAAVLPFLTPQWVAFEQGRANAAAWTGYTIDELNTATGAILSDLVLGPADFDVAVRGEPVLDSREQGHMRDVRTVFVGLWALAAISVVILLLAIRRSDRAGTWSAVRRGSIGLVGLVLLLGIGSFVAFDAMFELFHRIFFPAGSYTFDPASERLVQLFPFQFWEETAFVVGVLIAAIALLVALVVGRRRSSRPRPEATVALVGTPAAR